MHDHAYILALRERDQARWEGAVAEFAARGHLFRCAE
jgi:hypothetical protein